MAKRILLAGGGTGGHITPLMAVKAVLEKTVSEPFEFLLIGSNLTFPEGILPKDIRSKNILAAKWRRYFSFKNFLDLFKIPLGLLQAFWYIFWFMPQVCLAKGGYASVPSVLICWLFRIPVILHESDTVPGSANRFLARFAKHICLGYSSSSQYFKAKAKLIVTGNPVRKEIIQNRVKGEKPVLLVLGGSQGAEFFNEMMVAILPELLKDANVIHQTGLGKGNNLKLKGYKQVEYIQDIGQAYAVSDLVLTRAGANTLAELSALGKPSIIVPLPNAANDHQRENAYTYSQNQAAIVLEQDTLGPLTLLEKITSLIQKPEILKNMGDHARELNTTDASERVAKVIQAFLFEST